MPKKFDGSHRGFGFVELVTRQEAANAYKALANTHLYGRHLVLQWAKAVRQLRYFLFSLSVYMSCDAETRERLTIQL
jgi:RNA recognition motif-containing protein